MKKFILFLLLINSHTIAYNQIITGRILDKETGSPVSFAAIYFNGTFVGTYSDINGNFRLDVTKNTSMPLTISCQGYSTVTLSDFLTDKPINIYLEPKVTKIDDVVVTAKSLVRKRKVNLRLFKEIFLGTTDNALNCEIINEKDITFNYYSDRDTLKAFASQPILINNAN